MYYAYYFQISLIFLELGLGIFLLKMYVKRSSTGGALNHPLLRIGLLLKGMPGKQWNE
jgi:hypothetical protein